MTEPVATTRVFGTAPIREPGFYDFRDPDTGAVVTRWCYQAAGVVYVAHRQGQPYVLLRAGWTWHGPVVAPEGA